MSETLVEEFVKQFKKDYSLEEYQENQSLSEEDGLFIHYSLLALIDSEESAKEQLFNSVKALPEYADYFSVGQKAFVLDRSALAKNIEKFVQMPLQGNSGIAYSDSKQALKSDNQIFREEVVERAAASSGMQVKQIKQLLSPKLDEFLKGKFDYYKQALLNQHGLYSYSEAQK